MWTHCQFEWCGRIAKFENHPMNQRAIILTKQAVRAIAFLVMRTVTCAAMLSTLVMNARRIGRADWVLLVPHTGFGHTLSAPDWLRRLNPRGPNLAIVGRWPERHNAIIAELWGRERFIWMWSAIWLPGIGLVADPNWCEQLFRMAEWLLRQIWPDKKYLQTEASLMSATPRTPWAAAESKLDKVYELRHYALRLRSPAPALHLGLNRIRSVERALSNLVGRDCDRRCNLYLRHRAGDITNTARCSQPVAAYLPMIRYLLERRYLIMVTGDIQIAGTPLDGEHRIVDWRRLGISRDLFQVYAGTETDLHIGNLSGGSAYTYVSEIQTVLVDALSFGDAYPKATIQYKRLLDTEGSLVPLPTLFDRYTLDFECRGCRVVDATAEEMLEVVRDVVENGLGIAPYGISPESLGIHAPILKAADARLSPVWVRGFSFAIGAHSNGLLGLDRKRSESVGS
jgi:hypothetical protein